MIKLQEFIESRQKLMREYFVSNVIGLDYDEYRFPDGSSIDDFVRARVVVKFLDDHMYHDYADLRTMAKDEIDKLFWDEFKGNRHSYLDTRISALYTGYSGAVWP